MAVRLGNPARISDTDSRKIWIPRWSSDGFSKDRGQIVFPRESKRLTDSMVGLFSFNGKSGFVPDLKIAGKRKMDYNGIKRGE
jgi:hypothetical protein